MIFTIEESFEPELGVNYQFINKSNVTTTLHTHEFHEMFLVLEDCVTHHISGRSFDLHKNTLVFIRPDDAHYFSISDKGAFVNIVFDSQIFHAADKIFSIKDYSPRILDPQDAANIINELKTLSRLMCEKSELSVRLKRLVVDTLSLFAQSRQSSELPRWLNDLLIEIGKDENFTKGLDFLYNLSGKTPEHMTRTFKKYLNRTPTKYLNILKLNLAKNLLLTSNDSVTDICFSSGFNDTSYFFVQFKKHYLCSPGEYRRRYRKTMI